MKDAMKTIISVVAALALTLALATTAYAQSSIDGYNDEGGRVQSQVQGGQDDNDGGDNGVVPASASSDGDEANGASGGNLPFTGLDIALLAAAGGLLVGAGVGMRRLTRAPESA